MTSHLMQTTRIAVLIEADTKQLAELMQAIALIVGFAFVVFSLARPAIIFTADFVEAATFTGKVMGIIVSALLFGFCGVKL